MKKGGNAPYRDPGGYYVVGPRGNSHATVTFRDSKSGQFTTRVMSTHAFKSASGKANTVLKEAMKNPPAPYKK